MGIAILVIYVKEIIRFYYLKKVKFTLTLLFIIILKLNKLILPFYIFLL